MNKTVIILSLGKTFKIFVVTLLFVSSGLTAIPRPQLAQSSPNRTVLPTDWPSVYFCNGTVYNETFTGEVGDTITVALVVSNLTNTIVAHPDNPIEMHPLGNLDGFDVQISWDPTVLKYVSHTLTVPVEDYPNPVPPSPYAGILHEEAFRIMNVTDENNAIPGSESGTMAWFAYGIMPGVAVFNGNGTFFTMTFNVTKCGSSPLKLTNVDLSGAGGTVPQMFCHKFDGLFRTIDAPTADFTFWPDVGVVDNPVIFNASTSRSPINASISKYIWDFDDTNVTTVSNQTITHSYSEKETYTVSLVVEDSNGTRSSPKTEQVSVVEKRNVKISDVSLMPDVNVLVNSTVDIEVRVENDGRADENCTVKAYYNATSVNWTDISTTNWIKIGETNVSLPLENWWTIEHLTWNTTGVPPDTYYYVLANATLSPYEEYANDNNRTSSDAIFVRSTPLRDVVVEELEVGWQLEEGEPFKSPVLDGETTTFQITVQNEGTENETAVNVTLCHDGSVLKSWNESIPYGETIELTCTELFDPGSYNITGRAIIENDAHPDNDFKQGTLQVIETPTLNFTYDPKTVYINQTVFLNASQSFHREPGASITEYKWQIRDPTGTIVKTLSGPDLVNITYQFGEEGEWRVVLSVTDSYGIKYDPAEIRKKTSAYQIDTRIDVQAPAGFPIEYILVIVVIVIVIAALAIIIYRRRRAHT